MQLEEAIAKEFADIIKDHTSGFVDRIVAIEKAMMEAKELPQGDEIPTDVIDEIAKAVALLAEAPPLTQASGHPMVVNFSPSNTGKKVKTITTRRDEAGNLVARVIED